MCNPGEHRVLVARGVPSRLPGAPSALSPPRHPSLPGLEPPLRPRPFSPPLPGSPRAPCRRRRRDRGGQSRKHWVCLCGVSWGRRATCTSPAAAAARKTREQADQGKRKEKQSAWICLPRTGAAHADLRGECCRSRFAPRPAPPRRLRPACRSAARTRSPRASVLPRRVLERLGLGRPAMWP